MPSRYSGDRKDMFYWQVDRHFDARETKEIFLDRHANFDKKDAVRAVGYGMPHSKVMSIGDIISFGSVNVVLNVGLADGQSIVARFHPPGVKNGYFHAEAAAAEAARAAGVPAYRTYFIEDRQTEFPFDFMLMERMPGNSIQSLWPIASDLDKSLLEQTGEALAKFHMVKTHGYGFFDNRIAKTDHELIGLHGRWEDHLNAALEKNLDYLTGNTVISVIDRKRFESVWTRNGDVIECENPRLVHNDIADWNLLSDGKKLTGVIDWDECFSGDPVMDFAQWSVFFPYGRMEHLKRGYLRISPLPDGFEEKLHLYRLRYIVSKSVSRHMKQAFAPNEKYRNLLDYALKILQEEFAWYGV